jgi:hypothetical protein
MHLPQFFRYSLQHKIRKLLAVIEYADSRTAQRLQSWRECLAARICDTGRYIDPNSADRFSAGNFIPFIRIFIHRASIKFSAMRLQYLSIMR